MEWASKYILSTPLKQLGVTGTFGVCISPGKFGADYISPLNLKVLPTF